MRDHNKAFGRLVAQIFTCPDPVYEFGSYQVDGQVGYSDMRPFFRHHGYVGCDIRLGPGVDQIEDVSAINIADVTVGTVLCLETLEHVFELRRAFDEVFRVLRPGGLFVLTSVFTFPIHEHPDDYWRMTPQCLRKLMTPYAARLIGFQGPAASPHTVMAVGVKAPAPDDVAERAARFIAAYQAWLEHDRTKQPISQKFHGLLGRVYRSKGERRQLSHYYTADFMFECDADATADSVQDASGTGALRL